MKNKSNKTKNNKASFTGSGDPGYAAQDFAQGHSGLPDGDGSGKIFNQFQNEGNGTYAGSSPVKDKDISTDDKGK